MNAWQKRRGRGARVLSLFVRHRKLYGLAGWFVKALATLEDVREIHNSPERQNRFRIVKYLWRQQQRGNKDNEVRGGGL